MTTQHTVPVYKFKGREYRTVAGLSRALFADSGCTEHSMVGTDRKIRCTVGRGSDMRTVAVYAVTKPVVGEPMYVTREGT